MLDAIAGVGLLFLYALAPGAAVGALTGAVVGELPRRARTRSARDRVLLRCVAVGAVCGAVLLPLLLLLIGGIAFDTYRLPSPS